MIIWTRKQLRAMQKLIACPTSKMMHQLNKAIGNGKLNMHQYGYINQGTHSTKGKLSFKIKQSK